MKKYRLLPDDWSPKEIGTLVYVADGDRILLIEKLRGHGAGLINAPGGRLEHGVIPLSQVKETINWIQKSTNNS